MIVQLIIVVLTLLQLLILARVLLGWTGISPYENNMARWIFDLTEPILQPIREMMPQTGMMDFSPIVVFIIIMFLMQILASV